MFCNYYLQFDVNAQGKIWKSLSALCTWNVCSPYIKDRAKVRYLWTINIIIEIENAAMIAKFKKLQSGNPINTPAIWLPFCMGKLLQVVWSMYSTCMHTMYHFNLNMKCLGMYWTATLVFHPDWVPPQCSTGYVYRPVWCLSM